MAISSLIAASAPPPKATAVNTPPEPLPAESAGATAAPPFSRLFAQAQRIVEARAAAAPAAVAPSARGAEASTAPPARPEDAAEPTPNTAAAANSDRALERRQAGRACVRPAAAHAASENATPGADLAVAAARAEREEVPADASAAAPGAAVPAPLAPLPEAAARGSATSHALPAATGDLPVALPLLDAAAPAIGTAAGAAAAAAADPRGGGPAAPARAGAQPPGSFASSLQAAAAAADGAAANSVGDTATQAGALPRAEPLALAADARAPASALPATPAAAAADAPISLATPVTSPEFRQALGVQVSMLARDGRQQATLQLHPVELGPISVRIAMDGDQARVDFACEVAGTRDLIAAGWPELATALQDAGFTLSGGGVSQQPSGQPGHAHGGGSAGSSPRGGEGAGGADPAPAAAPQRARVRAGGVDVFA